MSKIAAPPKTSTHDHAISDAENIARRNERVNSWSLDDVAELRQLRCVQGLDFDVIATRLGRTVSAVKSKLGAMGWKLPRERYLEIKRTVARRNSLAPGSPFAGGRITAMGRWDDGDAA